MKSMGINMIIVKFNILVGPRCRKSHGEKYIGEYLLSKSINFIPEFRFDNCRDKNTLPFDFYLPNYKILIEFDGEQHFVPHSFSTDRSLETKQKNLKDRQQKDQIKTKYCLDNNIKLIRIPYWDLDKIEEILGRDLR